MSADQSAGQFARSVPYQKAIVAVLRWTVAVQCLGNAHWFLRVDETPLLSLMWGQADVGGWGWSESTALAAQQAIGWYTLIAAMLVLVGKKGSGTICAKHPSGRSGKWFLTPFSGWILWPLVMLQLSIAGAMCQMHLGFQPAPHWLAPQIASLFPWATQAARIAAPLLLWMLAPDPFFRLSPMRTQAGIGILRGAIALVFLAHGIEALSHHPEFLDLIIVSARKWPGWNMSEQVAEQLLTAIGAVDIVVAGLCLVRHWPAVAWYMAFWGAVTAASRVTAGGWAFHWHEFATRMPHAGLPLALALYWMSIASVQVNHREIPS